MMLGSVLFNFKQMFRLKQMKTKDAAAFKGNTLSCMIFSGLFCVIVVCGLFAFTLTIPVEASGMFDASYTAGKPNIQHSLNQKFANFHDICEISQMQISVPQNIDAMITAGAYSRAAQIVTARYVGDPEKIA